MKKRWICSLLAMILLLTMPVLGLAEDYEGSDDWKVSFTSAQKMESNFKSSDIDDAIAGLQPGDTTVFTVSLVNENSDDTEWYMSNEVLQTLEDTSGGKASGGAYSYTLTYTDKKGAVTTLFSSDTVGGESSDTDDAAGLHEVTKVLENYIFLDTLSKGDKGIVTLEVGLDGETQGNNYQDTLADIQINFAVEVDNTTVVKTGDLNQNLLPVYCVIMLASGGILLLVAALALKGRRKEGDK